MGMYIAIDFDGTIVEHRFPQVGPDCPGAFEWLRRWQDEGAKLILLTMRSDGRSGEGPENGPVLTDAVQHCRSRGLEFWAVNANPDQDSWAPHSRKVYAHRYVDDAAFGCPMVPSNEPGRPPHVDWSIVGPEILRELKQIGQVPA